MKRYLMGLLAEHGISLQRSVSPKALRSLIERLKPVTTDRGLIRIGGDSDGGYLVPDALDGIVACFSPGVSDIATFEADIAARGIPCHLADGSVNAPPCANELFHFTRKFLGVVDDGKTMTLDTWVGQYAPPSGDLLLQMDIEGDEWLVFLSMSHDTLMRFRIIVVEVHSIWQMMSRLGFRIMKATFDKLLREFCIVHIHPNNVARPVTVAGMVIPSEMEITLLRRNAGSITGKATQFPHPLDRKNVAALPDLALPPQWYG
jgi:hypothetical protein